MSETALYIVMDLISGEDDPEDSILGVIAIKDYSKEKLEEFIDYHHSRIVNSLDGYDYERDESFSPLWGIEPEVDDRVTALIKALKAHDIETYNVEFEKVVMYGGDNE